MQSKPQLSFVIPVKDEERSIDLLAKEISETCKKIHKSFEIIFVDDGSTDNSLDVIKRLNKSDNSVKGIKHRRNFGKAAALTTGFQYTKADIVFSLDGDLQDNPSEIPSFLKKLNQGYDVVSGWKKKRLDPIGKTIPSKIFNYITAKLTGVDIHDFNCGFKVYKRQVLENLNIYGELYRFIPALVHQRGYKVGEIIVKHRKRKYGKSKYGAERMLRGFLDLITVLFLGGYSTRPGHFFGLIGILFFIPGFLIGLYITYLRLTTGGIAYRYPLLFLGALLMIVGVQFISTGLLGEMFLNSQPKRRSKEIISEIV